MERKRIVLDSYAILAFIEDGKSADIIGELLTDEKNELFLSLINLGEVYYIIKRRYGIKAAEEATGLILLDDSIHLSEVPWSRIKDAANLKATGKLSYADSFVLALALELKASIVTGDPEIITAADQIGLEIIRV